MKEIQLMVDELTVHIIDDETRQALLEAQHRGQPIGGPYSVLKHPPHTPGGQPHLHVYKKQNQLLAINFDGSAHDSSHHVRIPNKVATAIKQRFPDIILPNNNLIESIDWLDFFYPSLRTIRQIW